MTPFTTHTGTIAALPRVNVDTDQIIPKQFLKRVERTGFGPALFNDWRYLPDGSPNPRFELNQPKAAGASILIAGANFGCGSSREHAPWALRRVRLPRHPQRVVRRHLLRQLLSERNRAGAALRGGDAGAVPPL